MTGWYAARDWLLTKLEYPELRGVAIDSPELTIRRRELLQRNRAAALSFAQWYRILADVVREAPDGARVELGCGGGFLERFIPGLIKTDVVALPFIDCVCRAEQLPFGDDSISVLLMVNVLHHVENAQAFFDEAARVLTRGGVIAMIEPAVTPFSRFVYRYLHHEPFDPTAREWQQPPSGRLSGGNDALPWIIFVRDRLRFQARHPKLCIERYVPHSALSHLLSGGVTTRPLAPLSVVRWLCRAEAAWPWLARSMGLFCTVVLRRTC